MRNTLRPLFISSATLCAATLFAGCSGGDAVLTPVNHSATPTSAPTSTPIASPSSSVPSTTPTTTPTSAPTSSADPTTAPTQTPTTAPTAQPQVVHIGFSHAQITDPTFGDVAFYTGTSGASDAAAVVRVVHGSSIVFTSDSGQPSHTASGLGPSSFPASFDNTGGTTATGSTIDGETTWSTGTLAAGASSAVFTVGPPGNYFFGCFYHYNSSGMRDVIVSQ